MTRQELTRLAKASEAEIRDAFLSDFRGIVSSVVLEQLVDAVRAGDIDRAWNVLGVNQGAFTDLTEAERAAFLAGGVATARTLDRRLPPPAPGRPAPAGTFRFTMDDGAETASRTITGALIREISEEARAMVRDRIDRGIAATEHPRHVALDIVGRRKPGTHTRTGGMLGLTRAQEEWVQNADADLQGIRSTPAYREWAARDIKRTAEEAQQKRREFALKSYLQRDARDRRFDPTVRRAIREGRPVSAAMRQKIIAAYRSRLLKVRGETIARTEALRSLNAGSFASIDQAVEGGRIAAANVTRTWLSAQDERVRAAHRSMNGQKRAFGQPFDSPTGAKLMYPTDSSLGAGPADTVSCRCVIVTDFARAA